MPIKGFINKALSLTSLFLTEGNKNGIIKGTVNAISVLSNTLTKRVLIKI